jgi:hypothetical protein
VGLIIDIVFFMSYKFEPLFKVPVILRHETWIYNTGGVLVVALECVAIDGTRQ